MIIETITNEEAWDLAKTRIFIGMNYRTEECMWQDMGELGPENEHGLLTYYIPKKGARCKRVLECVVCVGGQIWGIYKKEGEP